jgi:mannose-6-phosphate isomerase-like protein (cupin superfamily)
MVMLINLTAELAKLKTLQGLTPQTAFEEGEGFASLAPYRDSAIFAIKSAGTTAWERHLDGEEFVQVLEGAATIDMVTGVGPLQSFEVNAGMIAIVPKGVWHRARFAHDTTLLTVTPTRTDFVKLDVDDPRTSESVAAS